MARESQGTLCCHCKLVMVMMMMYADLDLTLANRVTLGFLDGKDFCIYFDLDFRLAYCVN